LLVELVSITLFYRDGVLGAVSQTSPQTITINLFDQLCFAVDYLDGSLGAGGYAISAAITFVLVNFYYVSHCHNVFLYLKG